MTLGEAIKKYPVYYIDEERYRTERSILGRVMYFGEEIDDNKYIKVRCMYRHDLPKV